MKMELDDVEIEVAHRMDQLGGRKPRQMVLRCAYTLQSRIFDYTKNLKGQRNDQDDYHFINLQLLEQYAVERKEINDRVRQSRVEKAPKPKDQQVKYEVKNKVLYVNNEAVCKCAPTKVS